MVYSSTILLLTGVPVANTTPFPPVSSSRYWHFINMSEDFNASVWAMPATFLIFVYRYRFLYPSASSTYKRSIPSSSKLITWSFLLWSFSFSNRTNNDFFVFSNCLIVNLFPFLAFSSVIPCNSSSIWLRIVFCWRSMLSGIFSNWLCPMIIASTSLVAILAQNRFLFLVSKSFLVATSKFAAG